MKKKRNLPVCKRDTRITQKVIFFMCNAFIVLDKSGGGGVCVCVGGGGERISGFVLVLKNLERLVSVLENSLFRVQ